MPTTNEEQDEAVEYLYRAVGHPIDASRDAAMGRLQVLAARRQNDSTQLVTLAIHDLNRQIADATNAMNNNGQRVTTAIDALSEESGTTGNRLAFWTMWLVFGTFLLGIATAALVYVEWSKPHEPPTPTAIADPPKK